MKTVEMASMIVLLVFAFYLIYSAVMLALKKGRNDPHEEYFWFVLTNTIWSLFFLYLCLICYRGDATLSFFLFFILSAASIRFGYYLLLKWKKKEKTC